MAPESERARKMSLPPNPQYPNYTETHLENQWCERVGCRPACDRELTATPETNDAATNPTQPTLTCSEVVERLARDCHKAVCTCEHTQCWCESDDKQACERCRRLIDDVRAQATAILHSWRERRVQELEGCLLGLALTLEKLVLPRIVDALKDFDNPQMVGIVHKKDLYWLPLAQGHLESSIKEIENALANSEWREQIRKGAKHE